MQLLNKANALGPVAALYNLSVVLEDAILENQTEEKFQISFGPKAVALKYLDEVTRELCPDLRYKLSLQITHTKYFPNIKIEFFVTQTKTRPHQESMPLFTEYRTLKLLSIIVNCMHCCQLYPLGEN